MSINSPEQFERLRACGMIVGKALRAMAAEVRAGVTTAELCEIGSRVLAAHGARSSPPMVYGFPGDVCISVNDEVVHGIPGDRVIQPGDLVKLDLTAEKDGYHTDSAVSVAVLPAKQDTTARELAHCAERAFRQALGAARIGNRTKDIGRAVEREVRRRGFCVVRELGGHGIGRTIHEPPPVPNYPDFSAQHKLAEGLVITIEPIIAAGTGNVSLDRDGWTYRTTDGSLSAHYEHTIVITRGEPVLLTAA
ncbi:MAG: type I methionyl aminopeptidase [Acidobacteria bacterium 13_1_40CM_4_57_6]|nr:MAG: type I methionyl aminopeptidase [Acidobacteria bacterium 13_1_40CM_4_57_6]